MPHLDEKDSRSKSPIDEIKDIVFVISGCIVPILMVLSIYFFKQNMSEGVKYLLLGSAIPIGLLIMFFKKVTKKTKSLFYLIKVAPSMEETMNELNKKGSFQDSMYKNYLNASNRVRIVVMLPLTIPVGKPDPHFALEVDNCLKGIYKTLKRNKAQAGEVDIIYRDHNNDPNVAIEVVKNELQLGSRHFICTMSSVCSVLASADSKSKSHFDGIINDYNNQHDKDISAVLLCTCAASSDVKPNKSQNVFRVFKDAKVEAKEIFGQMKELGILPNNGNDFDKLNVCVIYSDKKSHIYSSQAGSKFAQLVKTTRATCSEIIVSDIKRIGITLTEHLWEIKQADIVFLYTYHDANDDVIEFLCGENVISKKCILVTPTIFPKSHKEKNFRRDDLNAIRNLVLEHKNIKWFCSVPSKADKKVKIPLNFYGDLSEFCMYVTLQKLLLIIKQPDYNPSEFHKYWSVHLETSTQDQGQSEFRKHLMAIHEKFEFDFRHPYTHDPKIEVVLTEIVT